MIRKRMTVTAILDARYQRADGKFGVKIRVTYQGTQKYFPLNLWLSKEEWDKVYTGRDTASLERKSYITQSEVFVLKIAQSLEPFDFDELSRRIKGEPVRSDCLYQLLTKKSEMVKGRSGRLYMAACKKLRAYAKGKELPLKKVTPEFLVQYERWALQNGLANNSIWGYMKCVRTVFNDCLAEGIIKQSPFGKRKYQISYDAPAKRSLSVEDIKKLFDTEFSEIHAYAVDMWKFSYLTAGINLQDMAVLMPSNVSHGVLAFQRTKTKSKWIQVPLHPKAIEIIDKYKASCLPGYLLPIEDGSGQEVSTMRAMNRINRALKKVCKLLDIPAFTFYSARHSFASIMRQKGAAVDMISEAMGHADIKTTQIYLDRFTIEQYRSEFDKLI